MDLAAKNGVYVAKMNMMVKYIVIGVPVVVMEVLQK
jgi:hypothetical protein